MRAVLNAIPPRQARSLALWFITVVLISGCATVETLDLPHRRPSFKPLPFATPYRDYSGIFHVHSRYSHDSKGRLDEIVRAAGKARADFVVLTDHNTLAGKREKMEGFYGDTLVLIGNEVSTSAGHLAVLGVDREFGPDQSPSEIIQEVRRLRGLSFVTHGESPRTPWRDWSLGPLTGMEVYNLASDVYEDGRWWAGLKVLFCPPRIFFRSVMDRPVRYLRRWDELLRASKVVGVGGVDAHQKVRILGRAVDDYDTMFKMVQTHVWAKEFSPEAILEALAKGHVYVAFDLTKPVRNFLFLAEGSSGRRRVPDMMGDEVSLDSGLRLKVFLPDKGGIRLLRNGRPYGRREGTSATWRVREPGVYRVEVYRGRRLWILSNPIYVV